MMRLDSRAQRYGVTPGDILGMERGSWHAWIVMEAAAYWGDLDTAARVKRGGAMPVVVLGRV